LLGVVGLSTIVDPVIDLGGKGQRLNQGGREQGMSGGEENRVQSGTFFHLKIRGNKVSRAEGILYRKMPDIKI
jgi:hypothetical protein